MTFIITWYDWGKLSHLNSIFSNLFIFIIKNQILIFSFISPPPSLYDIIPQRYINSSTYINFWYVGGFLIP